MEKNIEGGKILDFFGPPGSGKTTIAHSLAIKLKKTNYKINEDIYIVNNRFKTIKRIMIKVLYTLIFSIKNFKYLRELFGMLGKEAFISKKEAMKQWINVCFVLTNLNKANGYDYLIADQGIVQVGLSLVANSKDMDVIPIINKLKEKINRPIKHLYVQVDPTVNLQRVNERSNGKSRIDNEDKVNRLAKLLIINEYCKKIKKSIPILTINNNKTIQKDSIDDISNEVLQHVLNLSEQ